MSLSPPEYIRHILDEIDYILSRISNMDYDSFVRDETLKRAFVRSIEVIGEAAKKLPEDIKAMQPDIEWRKVSGQIFRPNSGNFGRAISGTPYIFRIRAPLTDHWLPR